MAVNERQIMKNGGKQDAYAEVTQTCKTPVKHLYRTLDGRSWCPIWVPDDLDPRPCSERGITNYVCVVLQGTDAAPPAVPVTPTGWLM